ncbi:hypothetical protein G6F56_001249 [Rhizopus delemar]|nr:hypothetical protein G6F56_001249 [Rhizopus delemar]
MKIYRAETGQQVPWPPNKKEINSVKDLKVELEKCIGVPVHSQILMTSFGTQVKESNLQDILKAKDKDEYILFCYDRQYLDALPEEISNLLDVETPQLEPKVPPFTGDDSLKSVERILKKQTVSQNCETYLSLFRTFDDYSQMVIQTSTTHTQLGKTLVEEQKLQRMALNVAMTNLETHNKTMEMNVKAFATLAEKERVKQTSLVDSLSTDLEILKHIQVHPSLQLTHKKLVDWIDPQHIDTLKQETIQLCQFLAQETRELLTKTTELAQCEREVLSDIANKNQLHLLDGSLADIQEQLQRAQFLKDTRKRDRSRVTDKIAELLHRPVTDLFASLSVSEPQEAKKTLGLFHHLAEYQVQNYLPQLASYELAIRQKVTTLAISKRNSIQELIKYMNAVSQIQSEIASVEPRLKEAKECLDQFKTKYAQRDLESVRDILFGYGALMIEIVRRREYVQLVSEHGLLLSDLMTKYKQEELKKRNFFDQKVLKMLPFKPNLDEYCPQFEITTPTQPLSIQETPLQKKDITDFISLLGQAYGQSTNTSLRSTPIRSTSIRRLITKQTNEDEKFNSIIKVMYQQLDTIKIDFLKCIEADCKAYEARIQMLERQLENNSQSYSFVRNEDQYKRQVDDLKETIEKMNKEKMESDHEKEDQRLQIQELEQLLEDERQAYEHNRQIAE